MQASIPDDNGVASEHTWFWQIDDMFDYDNIGFCRAGEGAPFKVIVDRIFIKFAELAMCQYVTCADCEFEPLGIQQLSEKTSLLCHAKVKYADPATTGGHKVR